MTDDDDVITLAAVVDLLPLAIQGDFLTPTEKLIRAYNRAFPAPRDHPDYRQEWRP